MSNITQMDPSQITRKLYDEKRNSTAVHIVDGLSINTESIEKAIKDAFKDVKIETQAPIANMLPSPVQFKEIPVIIKETELQYIDRPIVVYETKIVEIEKPIIVTEIKVVEIEKQIVVKEQQIIEIKVPEIIKQYETIPLWFKVSFGLSFLLSLITNVLLIIKK